MIRFLPILALFAGLFLLSCKKNPPPPPVEKRPPTPPIDVRFQERILGEIPKDHAGVTLYYHPPLDDWEPYAWRNYSFSPDGTRFAYAAEKDGRRSILVVDGKTVGLGEDVKWVAEPRFDPSGRLTYLLGLANGDQCLVIDGVRTEPFQRTIHLTEAFSVIFSPDGRRYVYLAEVSGAWYMIVDGVKTKATDRVYDVTFSGDGSRIAWRVLDQGLFVDGFLEGQFTNPAFSDDGKRLAYTKWEKDGYSLVVDGRPGKAYWQVHRPVFSPRGDRVAYSAARSLDVRLIVVDAQESEEWSQTWDPFFTPDGRLVYVAQSRDGKTYWVAEGEPRVGISRAPRHVVFDGTGRHVAYEHSGQIFLDHRRVGIGRYPVLDPTGKHVAYLVDENAGRVSIGIDGKAGEAFGAVSRPVFSPDGKKVAYGAFPCDVTKLNVIWKVVTVER